MRSSVSPGGRSRTRLARWSVLLGAVLLALASPAVAATWTAVPSPNLTQFDNVLWGVDARSSTSAWAVGRADTGTLPIHRPVIQRWNGTRWSNSTSPLPPGGGELRDVDAISAGNAWAVGFTNSSNGNLTLTERWNGSGWTIVPSPNPSGSAQNHLLGVRSFSGETWAVGSHNVPGSLAFSTLTMRWRNGAWRVVPSPTPQGGRLFGVAALSPTRVYAVGQAPGIPSLVLRWNGSRWARETTPASGTVWDAAAAGPGTVWAVGQRGNPNVGTGRTFTLRTSNG